MRKPTPSSPTQFSLQLNQPTEAHSTTNLQTRASLSNPSSQPQMNSIINLWQSPYPIPSPRNQISPIQNQSIDTSLTLLHFNPQSLCTQAPMNSISAGIHHQLSSSLSCRRQQLNPCSHQRRNHRRHCRRSHAPLRLHESSFTVKSPDPSHRARLCPHRRIHRMPSSSWLLTTRPRRHHICTAASHRHHETAASILQTGQQSSLPLQFFEEKRRINRR